MNRKIFLLFFLMLFLVSCGNSSDNQKDNATFKVMIGRSGEEITVPTNPKRIISTTPTITDNLVDLGIADKIIAVDEHSNTENLNDDVIVMDLLTPDIEYIIELEPDLIIVTNYYGGVTNPYAILDDMGVSVVYVPTSTDINGIYDDILFYGNLTNTSERATEIVHNMKTQIEEIKELSTSIENKKTVYFEIDDFDGKLYSVGYDTYINDVLNIIGAKNIFEDEYSWLVVSEESIVDKNPDIIITSNSYNKNAVEDIKSRKSFQDITAVVNDDVYLIDADDISRGTKDIVNAIKEIATIIYPEVYSFE